MKNLLFGFVAVVSLMLGLACQSRALIPVAVDADVTASANEVVNYVQYIDQTLSSWERVAQGYTQIAHQLTEITNQVTQIENQVIQMERFGNPQTYVNLLNLNQFATATATLSAGVGRTVSQFQLAANGVLALRYTGNGLYADLTLIKDQFGNAVQFNQNNFRKFDAVNQMYTAYDAQLGTYNSTLASLNGQLTTALNNLNSAATQMETEKYSAQVNAISAQINSLGHQTNQIGQRVLVQNAMNANNAAAYQEAQNEAAAQGRQAALQRFTSTMSKFIGGGQ
jgi:hypothetical protein